MKKVVLKKRLIARDKDGKQDFRTKGSVAYLEENAFKLHVKMGDVVEVEDAKPKKSKPKPKPEPTAEGSDEPADNQPDI